MGGLCGTVPLSPHGTPALICEYGQTVAGAWAVLRRHGWRTEGLWRLLAPYQKLPLADYVATAGLTGIFRVKEHKPLSEGERCWIILEAERNAGGEYEPYDLFRNNCESAAFGLSPRRTRRVTPEVPMMFWMMFRWALVLVGVACLFQPSGGSVPSTFPPPSTFLASQTFSGNAATHVTTISKTTATTPTCSFSPSATSHCCERSNYRHVGGALRVSLFHLFVTVPLGLQLCIQLVRSTVHLTSRRSHLGERGFHHLLSKEVGRSVFVGSLSLGTLVHLPEISASSTLRSAVCASAAAATSATATAVAAAAAAAGNCHGRGIGTDDISDCTAKGIGGGCDGGGGGGGSERWPWHWVAFTAFFALPIANALFGVLCWVVIEVFKWRWGGVPVLTFVDSTPSLETATTTSTGKQPPAHPLKKVLKETTVAPPLKQLKKSKKSKKKMEKAAVIAAALAATATTAPIGNSELLVGTQRHREGQHRRHLASPVADPGVEKRKGGK